MSRFVWKTQIKKIIIFKSVYINVIFEYINFNVYIKIKKKIIEKLQWKVHIFLCKMKLSILHSKWNSNHSAPNYSWVPTYYSRNLLLASIFLNQIQNTEFVRRRKVFRVEIKMCTDSLFSKIVHPHELVIIIDYISILDYRRNLAFNWKQICSRKRENCHWNKTIIHFFIIN